MFLASLTAWQLLVVILIVLLLFGSTRIPDTLRNLGKGVSEFKKGLKEGETDLKKMEDAEQASAKDPAAKP